MSNAPDCISIFLPEDEATSRLGEWLASRLGAGDCLLLDGPIGAGKSHLARALIRAKLGRMEDIPSPSFTLVQTYEADGLEIWHSDLYRLSHPDEVWELGLDEAFGSALTLIEWPDRLGKAAPKDALRLTLSHERDGRRAILCTGGRPDLAAELRRDWADGTDKGGAAEQDRAALSQGFVAAAGWGTAERRFLAGDASDRSYDRLTRGTERAVLMDAPPGKGDDPASFIAIADHLSGLGLSAPRILARDLTQGFLLLEDLGDGIFARLLMQDPALEPELYTAATDVLVHLQRAPLPQGLCDLSAQDWAKAAAFALDWYRFAITGDRVPTEEFEAVLTALLSRHADGPRVLILRDYHAENLLWLPERSGLARVGLLDFQLGQAGQPGYDLVSLLQDARREVSLPVEAAMIRHFAEATGQDLAEFCAAYAVLGAQRALRILGIFARLCLVAGKPGYVALIPRVWGQLQRNLAAPGLEPLAKLCQSLLPEPSAAHLARIEDQCGHFR